MHHSSSFHGAVVVVSADLHRSRMSRDSMSVALRPVRSSKPRPSSCSICETKSLPLLPDVGSGNTLDLGSDSKPLHSKAFHHISSYSLCFGECLEVQQRSLGQVQFIFHLTSGQKVRTSAKQPTPMKLRDWIGIIDQYRS